MAQGKEHIPTDESRHLVEELSGYGLSHENIGALIGGGITRITLCEHYRNELDAGKAKANIKVGKRIFDKAVVEGDTTAMIWWSKTQMGWKAAKDEEVQEEKNNFSFQIHLSKDE